MKTESKIYRLLLEIIEDHNPELSVAEIDRFRAMPSLKEAIKRSAESRKENGHPYEHQQKNWNFWPDAIRTAMTILEKAHARFQACSAFDEIHELVKELLSDVKWLGPMYHYDVAVRIGAFLECLPKKVYLHRGTLEGAKRLGLPTEKGVLKMSQLPEPLQGFSPWEIEDMLCHLAKLARQQDRITSPA